MNRMQVVFNESDSGYSCIIGKKRYSVEIKTGKRGEPYISFTKGNQAYWLGNVNKGVDKKSALRETLKRKLGEEYRTEIEIVIARQEKLF